MTRAPLKYLFFFIIAACMVTPGAAWAIKSEQPQNSDCGKVTKVTKPEPPQEAGKFEVGNCAERVMPGNYQPYEFTTKLVACIEGTVQQTTINMMTVVKNEFSWLVAVLGTLVIIFYGIRMTMGERDIKKRGFDLIIKLAFIIIFMQMLPTLAGWVFSSLHWFMMLVTGGMSPWKQIDTFFGKIFGFGPDITMINGLIGLVGASLFSSKVGFSLLGFGVNGILNLIIFVLQMIYTYCLSMLAIGFLLTLAPIAIPLGVFFYTERYFKKWVDLIVSAILTPVLLFALVWMFLSIFGMLIDNIFTVIGGNDFKPYMRTNTPLCSWIMPSDPNQNAMMSNLSKDEDVPCVNREIKAPVQSNINPLARNAFDTCIARVPTMDFGSNDVNIMQQLSFAFITLWIFSSLMKSMVNLIPEIAASISSVMTARSFSSAGSKVIGALEKAKGKVQSMQKGVGGAAGGAKDAASFGKQMQNLVGKRDK